MVTSHKILPIYINQNQNKSEIKNIYFSVLTGAEPKEATATMKYNRNRNIFTTQLQIPDIDVEAGIKIGMTDSNVKGKSLTIEFSNKNVPQLSLTGRAK